VAADSLLPTPTTTTTTIPPTPAVEIVAYSQQSRFHRETFDANSTEIDLKGVNVSVNNKELLVDAHLRLKSGVRYGMVGQNGVGKSGIHYYYFERILSQHSFLIYSPDVCPWK
jgi:ATP-binding cassette, subfamily F, member 3